MVFARGLRVLLFSSFQKNRLVGVVPRDLQPEDPLHFFDRSGRLDSQEIVVVLEGQRPLLLELRHVAQRLLSLAIAQVLGGALGVGVSRAVRTEVPTVLQRTSAA